MMKNSPSAPLRSGGLQAGILISKTCPPEGGLYESITDFFIAAALKANPGKRHIVTSSVEHSSVLNYCMALEKEDFIEPSFPPQPSFPRTRESTASSSPGERKMDPRFREGDNEGPPSFPRKRESTSVRVTHLPVDSDGLLKLADLEAAIAKQLIVDS